MKQHDEIHTMTNHCSDMHSSREEALATEHPYGVYLDMHDGYPQVKIVAKDMESFRSLHPLFDEHSYLHHLPACQNCFFIRDNISIYPTHGDTTYTIPLTPSNFSVLQHLFSSKNGFNRVENVYQSLVANLPDVLADSGSESKQTDALLYDPLSFVGDEGEPIINDILTEKLETDVTISCFQRYLWERMNKQKVLSRKEFASRDGIALGAIKSDRLNDIFSTYSSRLVQCKNQSYVNQTENDAFKDRLRSDDLTFMSLEMPTQVDLVRLLRSNGRWATDGDFVFKRGELDPSHKAWQCGVYYQPIDPTLKQILQNIGLGPLADPRNANVLACVPYHYFKLLVLCFNIQKTKDPDMKEMLMDKTIGLLEQFIQEGVARTIPEAIITQIENILGDNHPLVSRYNAINKQYYEAFVHPGIVQNLLQEIQDKLCNLKEDTQIVSMETYAWDTEENEFKPIIIFFDGRDEHLIDAIQELHNPNEFTVQFVDRIRKINSSPEESKISGPISRG